MQHLQTHWWVFPDGNLNVNVATFCHVSNSWPKKRPNNGEVAAGGVAAHPFSQVVRSEYPIRQQRTSEKGAISPTYHSWKLKPWGAPVGETKLHVFFMTWLRPVVMIVKVLDSSDHNWNSLYIVIHALGKQTYDWKSINLNRSCDTFANEISFSAILVQEGALASFDDDHHHSNNNNNNSSSNNNNNRSHNHNHNHNSMAAPATLSVV